MARKRKPEKPNPADWLLLLELRLATMAHCAALKAVTTFLAEGKTEAAIARLDQTVTALHAVVRGQCAGMKMECPRCGTSQDVVAWVDDGKCDHCGGDLKVPGNDSEE